MHVASVPIISRLRTAGTLISPLLKSNPVRKAFRATDSLLVFSPNLHPDYVLERVNWIRIHTV